MRKPRTVTGRVALRLCDAVLGPAINGVRRMRVPNRSEWLNDAGSVFMAIAFQATQQGLDPEDLDNANGTAALEAIYTAIHQRTVDARDQTVDAWDQFLFVTVEWRRVVASALRTHKRGGYVRNPDEGWVRQEPR